MGGLDVLLSLTATAHRDVDSVKNNVLSKASHGITDVQALAMGMTRYHIITLS